MPGYSPTRVSLDPNQLSMLVMIGYNKKGHEPSAY